MDKRYKRPLNPKYVEPYYQGGMGGGGGIGGGINNTPDYYYHSNKNYVRGNHNHSGIIDYNSGLGGISGMVNKNYIQNSMRHTMIGLHTGGAAVNANIQTKAELKKQNNFLNRLAIMHLGLIQDQQNSLKDKDNEIEQLHLIKSELEARIISLERQLQVTLKRTASNEINSLPKPPPAKMMCQAEKNNVDLVSMTSPEHETHFFEQQQQQQHQDHQQTFQDQQQHQHQQQTQVVVTSNHHSTANNSKTNNGFNGKKVTSIFLQRVSQQNSNNNQNTVQQQQHRLDVSTSPISNASVCYDKTELLTDATQQIHHINADNNQHDQIEVVENEADVSGDHAEMYHDALDTAMDEVVVGHQGSEEEIEQNTSLEDSVNNSSANGAAVIAALEAEAEKTQNQHHHKQQQEHQSQERHQEIEFTEVVTLDCRENHMNFEEVVETEVIDEPTTIHDTICSAPNANNDFCRSTNSNRANNDDEQREQQQQQLSTIMVLQAVDTSMHYVPMVSVPSSVLEDNTTDLPVNQSVNSKNLMTPAAHSTPTPQQNQNLPQKEEINEVSIEKSTTIATAATPMSERPAEIQKLKQVNDVPSKESDVQLDCQHEKQATIPSIANDVNSNIKAKISLIAAKTAVVETISNKALDENKLNKNVSPILENNSAVRPKEKVTTVTIHNNKNQRPGFADDNKIKQKLKRRLSGSVEKSTEQAVKVEKLANKNKQTTLTTVISKKSNSALPTAQQHQQQQIKSSKIGARPLKQHQTQQQLGSTTAILSPKKLHQQFSATNPASTTPVKSKLAITSSSVTSMTTITTQTKTTIVVENKKDQNKQKLQMYIKQQEQLQKRLIPIQQNQRLQLPSQQVRVQVKKLNNNLIFPPPPPPAIITPEPTPNTTPTTTPTIPATITANALAATAAQVAKPATRTFIKNDIIQTATVKPLQDPETIGARRQQQTQQQQQQPSHIVHNRALTQKKLQLPIECRSTAHMYASRAWEDLEFHCDFEFYLEEANQLIADQPKLEIPRWKDITLKMLCEKPKNMEDISDESYVKRHHKLVVDEIRRKKRDEQFMLEQARRYREFEKQKEKEAPMPQEPLPMVTFYPLLEDVEKVCFVEEVPVQAFGECMVRIAEHVDSDFSLPWIEAIHGTTAAARAKAQAVPVAVLGSNKMQLTEAQVEQQQIQSTYVFTKMSIREKNKRNINNRKNNTSNTATIRQPATRRTDRQRGRNKQRGGTDAANTNIINAAENQISTATTDPKATTAVTVTTPTITVTSTSATATNSIVTETVTMGRNTADIKNS